MQYVWSRLKFGFRFEEFINTTFGAIFGRKVKSLNILVTRSYAFLKVKKFFLQLKRNSLERFRVTCERTITVTANRYFLSNDSRECHFVKIGNSLSFGVKDSHGIDGGNLNPLGDGQIELFVRVIDHQLRLTPLEVGLDDSVPHLLNLNKLMRLKWISWRVCIWISWHILVLTLRRTYE